MSLQPCPDKPNCVSSCSDEKDSKRRVEPFRTMLGPEETMAAIRQVVEAQPRTRIAASRPGYLHAVFTSLVFRFKDDVEFEMDAVDSQTVHVRSASRVGYSDLGVNRKRVEKLRELVSPLLEAT